MVHVDDQGCGPNAAGFAVAVLFQKNSGGGLVGEEFCSGFEDSFGGSAVSAKAHFYGSPFAYEIGFVWRGFTC